VVNLSLKLHSDAPPLPELDGYGHISVIGVMAEARGKGGAWRRAACRARSCSRAP
jgi:hypothetical protein